MQQQRVVLPAPLGPVISTSSPSLILRFMSFRAGSLLSVYVKDTFLNSVANSLKKSSTFKLSGLVVEAFRHPTLSGAV